MMDLQEREHWDYEMGAASELQNAVSLSRMELPPDDSCKIGEALDAGKFLVIEEADVFCTRTDAGIGSVRYIFSTHLTYEDAERALHCIPNEHHHDGVGIYILPRKPEPTPVIPYEETDIPF